MSNVPSDLRYTESHEWVRVEDDGTLTIGITDHAQELLGDLVYVELPEEGAHLTAGEGCGVVESVKAASDVYAPVAGEVLAVNEELDGAPETINDDPYDTGWMYRLKPENMDDVEGLMNAEGYSAHIED